LTLEILKILRKNAPLPVSGEELSRMLGVTRTAVWKHIRQLISEGYSINASSKKGYIFEAAPEDINRYEIAYDLDTKTVGKEIIYLNSIGSTNDYAKKAASEGAPDGTVVVADMQTAGKGRLGRFWQSPAGKGIYLSVILRPDASPAHMQIITVAAAAAAVTAIEKSTGLKTLIKWPNDIVIDGKKVCGILTEMNSELDRVNYIVLGIGFNYSQDKEDFPGELADRATSLKICSETRGIKFEKKTKLILIREFLKELDKLYEDILEGRSARILSTWKANTATLGKEVRVTCRDAEYTGTAVDITEDAGLLVRMSDGTLREIKSGEVSVRGLLGYY